MGFSFEPLFLDFFYHDGQLRLSWSARSTYVLEKFRAFELFSSWLNPIGRLGWRSWGPEARSEFQGSGNTRAGPVAQVARAHP